MTYDCNILATGSTGNAVQLNKNILLDCGVPFKKLSPIANQIKLVLLTHEHGDHFKRSTIKRLAAEHPLLRFGCCEWLIPLLINCGVSPRQIDRYVPGDEFIYGSHSHKKALVISPVTLFHDVPNCGYKIILPTGEKILYAVDTGNLDGITAPDFDLYLIEANYEEREIQDRMNQKLENNEFSYEARALNTHLSVEQAQQFLSENAGINSKFAFLHQHKEGKECSSPESKTTTETERT